MSQWSGQQSDALSKVDYWLKNSDEQVFRLFGYAGTGKTTLAKHFAEGVSGLVLFGAFTGKAAYVLQQKGCEGAITIHQMIYISREKGKQELRKAQEQLELLQAELAEAGKTEKEIANHEKVKTLENLIIAETKALEKPYFILNQDSMVKHAKLVIIDECSMIDGTIGKDLLSFGTKVLVLGDPAQLPPIRGTGFFTEGVTPDVMLTDIHRQAEESPIIRMATMVRNHQELYYGDYGDNCMVVREGEIGAKQALTFEQILVGRNNTRYSTNRRMRFLKGYEEGLPVIGDRLVCLRNNHDLGILNGAIYDVMSIEGTMDSKIMMSVKPEDETFVKEILSHEHHFLGHGKDLKWYEKKEAEEFDYGYALTVHKAQGSQYNSLLLFDESACFRKDKWKHQYTGITRAAEEITVVI